MGAILAKPITHPTKVDSVYPCWTLRQSRRWAAEQGPRASRGACQGGVFFLAPSDPAWTLTGLSDGHGHHDDSLLWLGH